MAISKIKNRTILNIIIYVKGKHILMLKQSTVFFTLYEQQSKGIQVILLIFEMSVPSYAK